MTKPLVERYEQILSQDPASTAFVELAKALIARGDYDRAIEVCQQGLGHHKDSVVGRVLWGKALIQLSRPAEAMEQFDQAIGIDRDNPHAYNLIGEVLLHKGLYRSALPILRKAAVLQPNDGRVRQWLEQGQRALAGGPAPVVADPTLPNEHALPDDESTLPPSEVPADGPTGAAAAAPPMAVGSGEGEGLPAAVVAGPEAPPAATASDLPEAWPSAPASPPVLYPLDEPAPKTVPTFAALLESTVPATQPDLQRRQPLEPAPSEQHPAEAPSVVLSDALQEDVEKTLAEDAPGKPARRELLEDLPPLPTDTAEALPIIAPRPPPELQAATLQAGPSRPSPVSSSGQKRMLLTDIPDQAESAAPIELPKVELSPSAAQAIAREYERELREKAAAEQVASQERGFLARHGLMVAVLAVVSVAVAVFVVVLLHTRAANAGRDLKDSLALARRDIARDTGSSYQEALKALDVAVKMAERDAEAWALTAYARAMRVAEHGGGAEERALAQAALDRSGVETGFPALALVSRYHLADAKSRTALAAQVLASKQEAPEVQELAGRILAAKGDAEGARVRFKRAIDVPPGSVRALVGLANCYREAGDCGHALEFYAAAGQVSPLHPERVVGAAECRLEVGQELGQALDELEKIARDGDLAPDLMARRALASGRILSALGRHDEAIKRLAEGARGAGTRTFDFNVALGEARRVAGDLEGAQGALELALKTRPKSDEAREALGRIMLARDRESELLARLPAEPDGRRVSLVRGMAYARLGDWKKARVELNRTRVGDKVPIEAIIYLALADAADGDAEHAQETLERVLGATRKAKGDVRVALGQLYWQRGAPEKALPLFRQAQEDPQDYEGACSLGRLLLSQGKTAEGIEGLKKAVARNGSHGEARHALGRAYLQQGKVGEARAQFEAWQRDNPGSAAAQRDLALVLHLEGREKEAEAAIGSAIKLGGDPEAYRIRAEVLFSRGDARDALSALQAANKRDPKDPETFCAIGRAYLRQPRGNTALKAFEAALREDAHIACGRIGLALAKLPSVPRGTPGELRKLAQEAPQPWDRTLAQAALARAQLATGAAREARRTASDAVAREPQSGDAQLALGLAAARLHDDEVAKAALEKALEREPLYGAAHLALADLLVRSDGDLERARHEYEAFLKSGGEPAEQARVRRALSTLKKKLATR